MDSMEIDFDLDGDDPIKEFLRHKLDEIKSTNASLENDLKTRSDLLRLSERRVAELSGALKIGEVWKRTLHSKCVFGIAIENSTAGNFKFTEVVLNWDSPTPLTYYVKFYEKNESDGWLPTDLVRASATALVVLEKAPFLKQAALNLEGFVKYVGEPREYQLPLPRLRVSAGDFTDPALEIQRFKLLRGADEEFLSYLAAATNDVTEFVGGIPGDGRRKVESLLEIDCMLKRLDVKSRKKYFLVDGISCNIDGCLLELYEDKLEDGIFCINVLSRSQEQLKHLLHYLHGSAGGVSILPKSREAHLKRSLASASQSFFSTDEHQEGDQTCRDLRRKMLQEISCIETFFTDKIKNGESSGGDYARFRSELSELEAQTDVLRVKCDV